MALYTLTKTQQRAAVDSIKAINDCNLEQRQKTTKSLTVLATRNPSTPLPRTGSTHNPTDQRKNVLPPPTTTTKTIPHLPAAQTPPPLHPAAPPPPHNDRATPPLLPAHLTPLPPPLVLGSRLPRLLLPPTHAQPLHALLPVDGKREDAGLAQGGHGRGGEEEEVRTVCGVEGV